MRRRIRRLLRLTDQKAAKREYKRDEQGRRIIPMTVQDDADFLSVYAEGDTPLIAADIADYLEEKAGNLSPLEALVLRIRSSCIDPDEQNQYREGVKEYYLTRYISCRKELRRNNFLAAFLAITGMLTLIVMSLIDTWTGSAFWTEVVDIIAWVFIWESVDVFAFRNHELREERLRCLSFMDMEIEFLPLSERK